MKLDDSFISIGKALAALLHPFAEVVIHDLKRKKIAAIFHNFSKRKIGDDSLLAENMDGEDLPDYFEPYDKTNYDGRRLKSTSAVLRDNTGAPTALLCINLDVSMLFTAQQVLQNFLFHKKQPQALFSDDWQEKIAAFVHNYLKKYQLHLPAMKREEKKNLIKALYEDGAFKAKHAAQYIAQVLGISRATVYQYLKEIKNL